MSGTTPTAGPFDRPVLLDKNPPVSQPRAVDVDVVRTFRPDIEGLRALAVLVVVVYHAGVPWLSGGFVGVDVFFVISGFLITNHLFDQLVVGRLSLGGFYARRVRRLLPMSALVLVSTVVAFSVLLPPLVTRDWWADARWAGAFGLNLRLALTGVDYQANPEPSPLQHFWSLGVEEQFYLCWPLGLLLVAFAWRRSGARVSLRRLLLVAMGVVALGSFAGSVWLLDRAQPYAYFLTPARAWELAAGGLLALATPWLRHRTPRLVAQTAALAGVGLVLVCAVLYDDSTRFPGPAALVPVLGAVLVIAAGAGRATSTERRVLGQPAAQWIGRHSYGWYLWHWPVLIVVPAAVPGVSGWGWGLVLVAAALGLTVLSRMLVEDPVRRAAWVAPRRRALVLGAALTALAVLVPTSIAGSAGPTRGAGPAAPAPDLSVGGITDTLRQGLQARTVPANLTPALDRAAADEAGPSPVDGLSCMASSLHQESVSADPAASCVYGDPEGAVTVALTGDSHAEQWLPAFDELGRERNWRVVNLTKSSCPLFDLPVVNARLGREFTECYAWRTAVFERLGRERPDIVVTAALVFADANGDEATEAENWSAGVGATVDRLSSLTARVVVLEDTPWPGSDVPRCLAAHLDDASACALATDDVVLQPLRRKAVEDATTAAGARFVPTVDWLCVQGRCPVVLDDTLVYRDQSHLSATFARGLAPTLGEVLQVQP